MVRLRRLARSARERREQRRFVVEGAVRIAAALDAGAPVEALYVAPVGLDDPVVADARRAGVAVRPCAAGVLESAVEAVTPQPHAAVCRRPAGDDAALAEPARGWSLAVVCVAVGDPGNLGAIVRTADAAGADAVVCAGPTADPFGPKAVRASAGALFALGVHVVSDPAAALAALGDAGLHRVGAVARGGVAHHRADLCRRVALVVGSEAHGLPASVAPALDERVTIGMRGRGESLNVAAAAAVLCFEARRQRDAAPAEVAP